MPHLRPGSPEFSLFTQNILRKLFVCVLLLAAGVRPSTAQSRTINNNAHGWFTYFGDHPLGESKWGVHLEGQYRRHDVLLSWQQLLLRPAVNYDLNKHLMLSAGYAYARTWAYGGAPASPPTNEHRLWEQALVRYKKGPAAFTTRLRLEQRFLGSANPQTPGFRYENRFRAWEQITLPIGGRKYWTAYNEVWFYVKPYVSRSVLDQNRAYSALGFNLKPGWRLELGYMNQAIWQRSGAALDLNHTAVVSIYSNARFKLHN